MKKQPPTTILRYTARAPALSGEKNVRVNGAGLLATAGLLIGGVEVEERFSSLGEGILLLARCMTKSGVNPTACRADSIRRLHALPLLKRWRNAIGLLSPS